jgi:hypothetical protein
MRRRARHERVRCAARQGFASPASAFASAAGAHPPDCLSSTSRPSGCSPQGCLPRQRAPSLTLGVRLDLLDGSDGQPQGGRVDPNSQRCCASLGVSLQPQHQHCRGDRYVARLRARRLCAALGAQKRSGASWATCCFRGGFFSSHQYPGHAPKRSRRYLGGMGDILPGNLRQRPSMSSKV